MLENNSKCWTLYSFGYYNTRAVAFFLILICMTFPDALRISQGTSELSAAPRSSPDLLILKNGKNIEGRFVESTIRFVLFRPFGEKTKRFARDKVEGIVVGEKTSFNFWNIFPGVVQYRRGQDLKGTIFTSLAIASFGTLIASTGVLGATEAELRTKPVLDQQQTNRLARQAETGFIMLFTSAGFFTAIYAMHLVDWFWFGKHYHSLFSYQQKPAIMQDEFHLLAKDTLRSPLIEDFHLPKFSPKVTGISGFDPNNNHLLSHSFVDSTSQAKLVYRLDLTFSF